MCETGMWRRVRDEIQPSYFGFKYYQSSVFIRPQWPCISLLYPFWRLFWVLWNLGWLTRSIYLIADQAPNPREGTKWLIYLTNQAYLILTCQSLVHLVVVVVCRDRSKDSSGESTAWIFKMLWFLTTINFDFAVIVTVLYWTVVFKKLESLTTVMTHAVNSVYVLSDQWVTSMPVRLLHVVYPLVYGGMYLVFTLVYHWCHGTNTKSEPYIYKALDWSNPRAAAGLSLGSLLVGVPVVHLLQFLFYLLRHRLAHRHRHKFSPSPPRNHVTTAEQVDQQMMEKA